MGSEQETVEPQLKQEQVEINEDDNQEYEQAESDEIDNTDDDPEPVTGDDNPPENSSPEDRQRTNGSKKTSPPGSILNKKIKQLSSQQIPAQSSLQSLMQATGMDFSTTNVNSIANSNANANANANSNANSNANANRFSPQIKRKKQDLNTNPSFNPAMNPSLTPALNQALNQALAPALNPSINAAHGSSLNPSQFNQTTSSLFSILAGLTQQQAKPNPPRSAKPAHGANAQRNGNNNFNSSINNNNNNSSISNNNNNNFPINSSLLTLLNEKISGSVASSQQKKNLDPIGKTSNSRANSHLNNGYYPPSGNYDTNGESLASLNPFIESIAKKTGSNIGPVGITEARKIIEKFTTWLMLSSQTIADHYVAPYASDVLQQKPEISPSDVILAYKMMQKSQP